jgi:hypothetical protein
MSLLLEQTTVKSKIQKKPRSITNEVLIEL